MAKGLRIAALAAALPDKGCASIDMAEAMSPVAHASANGEHVCKGLPYARPPSRHAAGTQPWTWNIGAGAPPLPSNSEICR